MKEFDFLVFIGRFQPFHNGHLEVLKEALARSEQVIVLCGSAHQPRSFRNPWTVPEREQMIRACLSSSEAARVHIMPLMDMLYNDAEWIRTVQTTVNGVVAAHYSTPHRPPRTGLIGHSKDQSSYYLNLFPQWQAVPAANVGGISATPVREALFSGADADQRLPAAVNDFLADFSRTDVFSQLEEEYRFIAAYRKAWESAPYPPVFVTVDAVVVQSGHILLVERKARPGKGLMALPGGFINPSETLEEACVRELREETRLKVPVPVLRGGISRKAVFDDPHRSSRGRTITHAFYIALEPSKVLPKVRGGDDARHARWVPLAELNPGTMFEDHYFIVQQLTGMK